MFVNRITKSLESKYRLIPQRDRETRTEGIPIIFTYVLFPEGTAKAEAKVVQMFLLMFYYVNRKGVGTLRIRIFYRPF